MRRFVDEEHGLATIEYVIGVSSWNNGLVTRLQQLVTQLAGVR